MFTNVIAGVDERSGGRDALALARRLAAPAAHLTLVHVYPSERHPWRGTSLPYEAIEREDSLALLRRLREETGVAAELRSVGATSVGHGLHALAEHTGADLLVVGSSGRGIFGRVFLGDDTRGALNGAPCAVAIAPSGYDAEPELVREIGVAYNGSPESEMALSVARELAKQLDATLSAFEAVALPSAVAIGARSGGIAVDELVEQARERVSSLEGVIPHAAYGRAAEELAAYSASLDLLVVGSRGYGPAGRLIHGSTTLALARTVHCPLLVLPRAAAGSGVHEPVLEGVADEVSTGT